MLFFSHLFLVLTLIVGMSYSRYQSEWHTRVDNAATMAKHTLLPLVTDISQSISGRAYNSLLLPNMRNNLLAIDSLIYLDIQGISDYSEMPMQVRYYRPNQLIWRADVSLEEIVSAEQEMIRLQILHQQVDTDDAVKRDKMFYLLQKAIADHQSILNSHNLENTFHAPWAEPAISRDEIHLDAQTKTMHIVMPLQNQKGGRLWAVFDSTSLFTLKQQVWRHVLGEAAIALAISTLLIFWVTRWIVAPLRRLAVFMDQDLEKIELSELPEQNREDEIGMLASRFGNLVSNIKVQLNILKKQSDTDALTGLGSRYRYTNIAENYMAETLAAKKCFGLLVCDIDNFKAYNDLYGHAKGDEALSSVAAAMTSSLGTTDFAFRIGGEEFVVLLQAYQPSDIYTTAERIRHTLLAQRIQHPGNPQAGVLSLSIGAIAVERKSRSGNALRLSEVFEQADSLLYKAKAEGRNQVVFLQHNYK
ncbi:sensor domain-containing diguanylate cyclase [Reinekea marinisedimentorum]|nr:sensor domain-containing diguanylate cyclase [Reinekea marinisedimentorum]